MPSAGANAEAILIRLTVVSLALQSLIGQLSARGVLSASDLVAMRKEAKEVADAMKASSGSGPQVAGSRLKNEIAAWWDVITAG